MLQAKVLKTSGQLQGWAHARTAAELKGGAAQGQRPQAVQRVQAVKEAPAKSARALSSFSLAPRRQR